MVDDIDDPDDFYLDDPDDLYLDDSNDLEHVGTPRHSGRYPWGSGDTPEQRNTSWLGQYHELRKQGLSDNDIAKSQGLSRNDLHNKITNEREKEWLSNSDFALRLKDKGLSPSAIGRKMGRNESSVRDMLNPVLRERVKVTSTIAKNLQENVDQKKYIDIGTGVESRLGVARTKLDASVRLLVEKGYEVRYIKSPQQFGKGNETSMKVLVKPGTPWKEINDNASQIEPPNWHSEDGGHTVLGLEHPAQISSDRIHIRYADDGGKAKDGVIELRPGVEDLSLKGKAYAQVRIGVDDSHFMKGMAIYSDNVPEGKDIIYNTNKKFGVPTKPVGKEVGVFKPNEKDPDNPFGALVVQRKYTGSDGKEHLSAINVVGFGDKPNEEGKWDDWKRTLSSQVLSKQVPALAKQQLGEAYDMKKEEFDEITSLTNPGVKKALLRTFSEKCDSLAEKLPAAAMRRQASRVLLPFDSIKENEVYAPGFRDEEPVVLIRHPHGGIFEIPQLIVNNKNVEARHSIGDSKDAVGINPKVAAKLSGADFDGDTVIVIPNKNGAIQTRPAQKSLLEFDPKESYFNPNLPKMKDHTKQLQMGIASNLITDMTVRGADIDEIVRAVKHSMVVIDAQKHSLDYKKSAVDFNIAQLKKDYQGKEDGKSGGASTLISRAGSEIRVPLRKEQYSIDPATGKKIYKYFTGETKIGKNGHKVRVTVDSPEEALARGGDRVIITSNKKIDKATGEVVINPETGKPERVLRKTPKIIQRTTLSTRMAEADNAYTLSSGSRIEEVYAEHANKLKALANTARKELVGVKDSVYSKSAAKIYANEVKSLDDKLNFAYKNKPLERKANLLTAKIVTAKRQANPMMAPGELKKIKSQALTEQRLRVGHKESRVEITDREWEAIQSGAISNSKLAKILLNADVKKLKEKAMPRTYKVMSPARIARVRSMHASNCTQSEIADALGVSPSTISKILSGEGG